MQITKERDFTFRRFSDLGELDWYVFGPVLILISFGFLLLTSASEGLYLSKQFSYLFFAFLIASTAILLRIKFWQEIALWIYIVNIVFLIFVLIVGTTAMGAQRWIHIGPINIQPSELAKIAIIISLAAWFAKRPITSYMDIFLSALIVFPPILLIIKQPDLGTSLCFAAIFLGMAFWAGATFTHLLVVMSPLLSLISNAAGSVLFSIGNISFNGRLIELSVTNVFFVFLVFLLMWIIIHYKPWKSPWIVLFISTIVFLNFTFGFIRPVLWSLLKPYQQQRIIVFLNPESDPQGAGYHIVQSLLAIGNGGLFGYGWLKGRITKGSYVPAQHTDFVFSICGEEFGFIGSAFVIVMFAFILWRALYIARNSNDQFSSLLSIGIFSYFAFHVFINIGMSIGIMPITGVPLILLSYGGTALFVNLFSVFMLLSISWRTLPRKIF